MYNNYYRCFCSNENGERIFGQMWRNEGANEMTCGKKMFMPCISNPYYGSVVHLSGCLGTVQADFDDTIML